MVIRRVCHQLKIRHLYGTFKFSTQCICMGTGRLFVYGIHGKARLLERNPVFGARGGGGGGGTQIWFRRGCAAEAAKPVPIFKGHFGGKGYPLLRVFSQENCVCVYFSDEKGENI